MELERSRTWAEISMDALTHNYRALRAMLAPGCRFLGVVKADAYGHGAVPVAKRLVELGCEMLAVACLEEARQLRQAGITAPILILGQTPAELAGQVVELGLTQTVYTPALAKALSQAALERGVTTKVHLKLDTGMSRVGILAHDPVQAAAEAARLCALPGLEWEGVFTHFANADGDEDYTMLQFTRFLDTLDRLEKNYGITFAIRHCAASAAALKYPCTHLDMVRPGIALYGHYPDPSCVGLDGPGLVPVMAVRTRVADVRWLPAGTPVSYGCTRVLERDSRVAVLPVGYGDGLFRLLSNRLEVAFGDRRAPQLGRICMDMCMVDVTDLPEAEAGSVATLFDRDKPLEELSDRLGTIPYELLCDVSPRVCRIYQP
ncbi:MAG: alanine racemase [Oscillospiraceae bacterium]|nr:alanine racemase [Oscillospiraceae bacterium]